MLTKEEQRLEQAAAQYVKALTPESWEELKNAARGFAGAFVVKSEPKKEAPAPAPAPVTTTKTNAKTTKKPKG